MDSSAGSASGALDGADLELEPVGETLDAAEHAHRVASAKRPSSSSTSFQIRASIRPVGSTSSSAR